MQIDIRGITEDLINQQIAAGAFHSPEEVVDALASFWVAMQDSLGVVPDDVTLDELIEQQGVSPLAIVHLVNFVQNSGRRMRASMCSCWNLAKYGTPREFG